MESLHRKVVGKVVKSPWGKNLGHVVEIVGDSVCVAKSSSNFPWSRHRNIDLARIKDIEAEELMIVPKPRRHDDDPERIPERYFIL